MKAPEKPTTALKAFVAFLRAAGYAERAGADKPARGFPLGAKCFAVYADNAEEFHHPVVRVYATTTNDERYYTFHAFDAEGRYTNVSNRLRYMDEERPEPFRPFSPDRS